VKTLKAFKRIYNSRINNENLVTNQISEKGSKGRNKKLIIKKNTPFHSRYKIYSLRSKKIPRRANLKIFRQSPQ